MWRIKYHLSKLAVLPAVALAATDFEEPPAPVTGPSDIVDIIETVAGWMFGILIALAVVFLLYAAFLYLMSAGDQTKTAKAKNVLIYAIWALVIAVLAGGVAVFVKDFLLKQPRS